MILSGGAFPDDEDEYFRITQMAVRCTPNRIQPNSTAFRCGFQWVDLESHWSSLAKQKFLDSCAHISVIGSPHLATDSN